MRSRLALILCFVSSALAEDFKTTNGREYKDATVSRVEPDGIVLVTSSGISKVYFAELPKEVQERFHYDPTNAAAATPAPPPSIQENNAAAKEKPPLPRHDARSQTQNSEQILSALNARFVELQQQEDNLLAQIARADQAKKNADRIRQKNHSYSDPAELQLPVLKSHLTDVRREKADIRKQFAKAQR